MNEAVKRMVIAYLNCENVEYRSTGNSPWTKIRSLTLFEDPSLAFRIPPKTMTLNGLEVPHPSFAEDGYVINIDVKPSLSFKTNEDRRTFWHALCRLVKNED